MTGSAFRRRILLESGDALASGLLWRLSPYAGIAPTFALGLGTPIFARSTAANYVNSGLGVSQAPADTARTDYQSGVPGTRIEPTGTNLARWSEEFDNAIWTKDKSGTAAAPIITADAGLAPDGSMTADRAQFDVSGGGAADYSRLLQIAASLPNPHPSAGSIWIKANSGGPYVFTMGGDGGTKRITVTSAWTRFSNAFASVEVTTDHLQIRLRKSESTSVSADALIWGGQIETSPFSTSYVQAAATSGSRGADKLSYAAAGNLDPRAWTISLWIYPLWNGDDGLAHYFFDCGSNATQNRLSLFKDSAGNLICRMYGNAAGAYRGVTYSASGLSGGQWHNIVAWGDPAGPQGMALNGATTGASDNLGAWSDANGLGTTLFVGADLNQANSLGGLLGFANIWGSVRPNIAPSIYARRF
jgi:hypothetical protein